MKKKMYIIKGQEYSVKHEIGPGKVFKYLFIEKRYGEKPEANLGDFGDIRQRVEKQVYGNDFTGCLEDDSEILDYVNEKLGYFEIIPSIGDAVHYATYGPSLVSIEEAEELRALVLNKMFTQI